MNDTETRPVVHIDDKKLRSRKAAAVPVTDGLLGTQTTLIPDTTIGWIRTGNDPTVYVKLTPEEFKAYGPAVEAGQRQMKHLEFAPF